jgi:hypothetical protein
MRWTKRDDRAFWRENRAMDAIRQAARPCLVGSGLLVHIARRTITGVVAVDDVVRYSGKCGLLENGNWRALAFWEAELLIEAARPYTIADKRDLARALKRWNITK